MIANQGYDAQEADILSKWPRS